MDLSQVLSIATACIISAGGVGGITIAFIKFSSNIIAEKNLLSMRISWNRL